MSRITFLLAGKTGDGKSSTCNTIIRQIKFRARSSFMSTTKKCQKVVARVQGHNVVVVDSPGLADTDIKTDGGREQLKQELINIFATEPDGFDVILIVIRYDRKFTAEDKQVFQELHVLFGEEYVKKRGILVVTHKDKYDPEETGMPIEDFMKSQKGLFQEMVDYCSKRVVYFDNHTQNKSVRQEQVKQLLNVAVKAKQTLLHVTPEIVIKAREARDKAKKETEKPLIDEDTLTRLWLIIYSLEETPPDCQDVEHFKHMIQALKEQQKQLVEQDNGTGRLKYVIDTVSRLEDTISRRIEAIEKNSSITEAAEIMSKEIKALEMLLEESAEAQRIILTIHLACVFDFIISKLAALHGQEGDPKSRGCALQ